MEGCNKVKARKEDKLLRELFRDKLENAEVNPSQASGDELLRKLGRKEFLRFNALRFNIWHAGAIAATCVAAIIIYLANDSKVSYEPAELKVPQTEIAYESAQAAVKDESGDPDSDYLIISSKKSSAAPEQEVEAIADSIVSENIESGPDRPSGSDVKVPVAGKVLIPRPDTDTGKLRNSTKIPDIISASVTQGCCPLKVVFQAGDESIDNCRWSFGDGGYSDEKNPEWIFDVEGEYKVTLRKFNSNGSESVASCIITVNPKPVARFEIVDSNASAEDNRISFINYSTSGVKFRWDFGDGNYSSLFEPVHIYSQAGNYEVSLIVTSEEGCSDTLTVSNAFTGQGNFIDFPNAFLPNLNGPIGGHYSSSVDDAASVFHPVTSGVSEYQLRIFSKSGMLIFESNDISIGWDGYYKGQLCQSGVYIWKVRGNYINGEQFTKMGDLTLLKY